MNYIKLERARVGFTQEDLAERLGVTESTVRRWEKETSEIPSGKAKAMAEIFTCSIDYLFGLTSERT